LITNYKIGNLEFQTLSLSGLMAESFGHPDFPGLIMLHVDLEPSAIYSRQFVGGGVTPVTGKVRYVELLEFKSLLDRQANQDPTSHFVDVIAPRK
jgi:hypothetical protein